MKRTMAPKMVLVLCTGNSCRSQMAAGWINHLLGNRWEAHSAGTKPAGRVHPLAVEVMAEVGVDLSGAVPMRVQDVQDEAWDLVITVCDSARESCPIFPGTVQHVHLSFPDPAAAEGSEAERLSVFREVRDDIRRRVISELQSR